MFGKFQCPWCKKPKDKLLSTKSHNWICYDCAGDLEEKGEPCDFHDPTPPSNVHDHWPKRPFLP